MTLSESCPGVKIKRGINEDELWEERQRDGSLDEGTGHTPLAPLTPTFTLSSFLLLSNTFSPSNTYKHSSENSFLAFGGPLGVLIQKLDFYNYSVARTSNLHHVNM